MLQKLATYLSYFFKKSVLEFCMNSTCIFMVFLYDSLEVTKLGDIFNVLGYDFS